jgi:hypothetical protein
MQGYKIYTKDLVKDHANDCGSNLGRPKCLPYDFGHRWQWQRRKEPQRSVVPSGGTCLYPWGCLGP